MSGHPNQDADQPGIGRRLVEVCWGETARDRRNNYRYALWALVWVASVAAAKTLHRELALEGALAWAVSAVPVALSLVVMAAYLRFLREADELVRRIQLEGLAWGLGAGVIVHFATLALGDVGVAPLSAHQLVALMLVIYMPATAFAAWRYK